MKEITIKISDEIYNEFSDVLQDGEYIEMLLQKNLEELKQESEQYFSQRSK